MPETGGNSIRGAIAGCHWLVQATGYGGKAAEAENDDAAVGLIYQEDNTPFVNIDSTTPEGIRHAKNRGFADAQVADVVVSPYLYESNELFTSTAKGRLFAMFRHPIDRAAALFFHQQEAEPWLKYWTLERYAKSDMVEDNRMTRLLSNQLEGELTEEHYQHVVDIVRRKFLV